MRRTSLWVALPILLLCPRGPAAASDHIDGRVTVDHPSADLTDLFVFPSPERRGWLTMILTLYPGVAPSGHFADQVTYSFFLRPARVVGSGHDRHVETSGDYRVSCTFETPHWPFSPHWVTCKSAAGAEVRAQVDDTEGELTDSLRVFAGRRSDPFFFDSGIAIDVGTSGVVPSPTGANSMTDLNVLSVVVELNVERELGPESGSMFAVVGETTVDEGDRARRIDRIGRPEIANIALAPHGGASLRDVHNAGAPFDVQGMDTELIRQRLRENVVWYDKLNDTLEWTPESGNHLAELLLDDTLVIDTAKPCTGEHYFEIEQAILRGAPHTSCGGRRPNDDVVDVLYTLLINGGRAPQLSDGVDRPAHPASTEFPYLAAPSDGVVPRVKSFVAKAVGRLSLSGSSMALGIIHLLSGVTALVGWLVLLIYAVLLVLARVQSREVAAARRMRLLGVIGAAFVVTSLLGLVSGAFSVLENLAFAAIGVAALIRCRRASAAPHA